MTSQYRSQQREHTTIPRRPDSTLQADTSRTSHQKAGAGPGELALLAICFALLTGLVEAAIIVVFKNGGTPLLLGVGDHVGWMAPAANVPLFLGAAGLVVMVERVRRISTRSVGIAVFVALWTFAAVTSFDLLHVLAALLLASGTGMQVARVAARKSLDWGSLARRSLPVLSLLVLVAGAFGPVRRGLAESRAVDALSEAPGDPPNVLLVVLDVVRARSLSLYGYDRPTTPYLERFATQAILFEKAISTAPWTLPSHGSMFTGRLPQELSVDFRRPLDSTYPTLAEGLRDHGYHTAGFVANLAYISREYGLARGFVHYDDFPVSVGQTLLSSSLWRRIVRSDRLRQFVGFHDLLHRKSARQVSEEFLSWLDGREDSRPFFAFMNLFDAHEPYLPPPPFDRLFGSIDERGPFQHGAYLTTGHWSKRARKDRSDSAAWALDRAAYDGAIAYMDQELQKLLSALAERQLLDRTLIIITSDHGEHHGEHGLYEHTASLYMPLIHVPLLIRLPDGAHANTRITAAASLADLPATVMDLLALEADPPFPGRSLGRFWRGPGAADGDTALSHHPTPNQEVAKGSWIETFPGALSSVTTRGYQYIEVDGGTDELYDLERDPGQLRNLAEEEEFATVRERLAGHLHRVTEARLHAAR